VNSPPACENALMDDSEPDRSSFEDIARALAEEVNRAVGRLSELDLERRGRPHAALV
jgi:hypothetical protein